MRNGWIKMHRELLNSSIFADAELLRVLLYCLLQASYRTMPIPIGRQVITLQPGQLLYGRKAVSNRLGIGESKLRGLMNQLAQMGVITIESNRRYSIVTVLQWENYQQETDSASLFPFDCDFLDEVETEMENEPATAPNCIEESIPAELGKTSLCEIVKEKEVVKALLERVEDNQQKSALLTALEAAFDESVAEQEPIGNHIQEEKNNKINNNKKESENKTTKEQNVAPRAALRAVRRYRRADGELFSKGKEGYGTIPIAGHSVPGGEAAVSCGNNAEAKINEVAIVQHDPIIEMQYAFPDTAQLTQMEQIYWQQYEWHHADECNLILPTDGDAVLMELNTIYEQERIEQQNQVDLASLTWNIDDDMNWGVDVEAYTAFADPKAETANAIDPDEQDWIAAHKLFHQLWNKYPIKEGKHKVSEAQIMELYEVGKEAMLQAINTYKEKKRRVPKKYWMNGSTFFNGGYRAYLPLPVGP